MKSIKSIPWLAIIAGPILMIAPVLLTGKVIYWGTPFMQFAAWRTAGWESFVQEGLPYWNSLSGMGAPFIANYQTAWFYPPNWILLGLQGLGGVEWQAWGQALVIVLHWIFAGIGTALLLKRLGVNPTGQAVGGLAFGLSSYLVGRSGFMSMNAAAAWLPWVTLAADSLVIPERTTNPRSRILYLLGLILAIGLMLLSGHAQLSWYILVFSFAWIMARSWTTRGFHQVIRSAFWYGLASILGAGLAAVQLIPTLEYLSLSQRASSLDYAYTVNYSFYPWRLLGFVAPDLFGNPAYGDYWLKAYIFEDAVYIGLLPLMLAAGFILLSVRRRGRKDRPDSGFSPGMVYFLIGVILVSMIIAMGQFLPVFPFLYRYIPTFNMFQAPTRWSILAVFALAVLAGAGAAAWRKPTGKALYWTRLFTAGGTAVAMGAGLAWAFLGDVRPTFIRAAALAGVWCVGAGILSLSKPDQDSGKKKNIWTLSLLIFIILDLCIAGWSLNPPGERNLYSAAQTEAENIAVIADGHRVYIPPDVESEFKFEQMFFVGAYPDHTDLARLPRTLIPNTNLYGGLSAANNFDPLTTERFNRWMTILGEMPPEERTGWLQWMDVSMTASLSPTKDELLWEPVDHPVYYRFTNCVVTAKDGDDALAALLRREAGIEATPIGELAVILEGEGKELDGDCSNNPQPKIIYQIRNTSEHIITVNAPSGGYLVESESWYPGWKAEVDGLPVELEQADYLFRAVYVPAGQHSIRIYYRPTWGVLSRTITLLVSLVIIIVYVLATKSGRGNILAASKPAEL